MTPTASLKVTEKFPTTTTRPAAGTSVQSISFTRAPLTEGTASSQRSLCSPSGPKLTPSSSSTHRGNYRDPGWTDVGIQHHFHHHQHLRGTCWISTLTETVFPNVHRYSFWHKFKYQYIHQWQLFVQSWLVHIQEVLRGGASIIQAPVYLTMVPQADRYPLWMTNQDSTDISHVLEYLLFFSLTWKLKKMHSTLRCTD